MSGGRTKFLYCRLPVLNLRCEWCKQLFQWKPKNTHQVLNQYRCTCGEKCKGRLASWEFEKAKGKHEIVAQ
jgi:hypothetical protein